MGVVGADENPVLPSAFAVADKPKLIFSSFFFLLVYLMSQKGQGF